MGKLFQSLGVALEKALSPNVEWVLGTTSCSSAAERRDLAGMYCCYKVRHVARSLTGKCTVDMEKKFVSIRCLMGSQCRCLRTGVMCILPGVLVTRRDA